MSGFKGRKASVSPSRSALGLGSINQNKERVDKALKERFNQNLDELAKLKREYRQKEHDYERQLALVNQTVSHLEE